MKPIDKQNQSMTLQFKSIYLLLFFKGNEIVLARRDTILAPNISSIDFIVRIPISPATALMKNQMHNI